MSAIYDDIVLYVVFKAYFAYLWWGWLYLLVLLVLALPSHRLAAKVVVVTVGIWHLACLALWDMYSYAPVASWILGGAVGYRIACWLWFLVPHGWFSTWLLRWYVRFDPRCAALLDLARARRDLPVDRTKSDREQDRPEPTDLPAAVVRFLIAATRGLEWAIRACRRLPRYWRLPHTAVHLDQPHLWQVLQSEAAQARLTFQEVFLNTSLAEYRALSDTERHECDELTRRVSQRLPLLYDAMAEYQAFLEPLPAGHKKAKWAAYNLLMRSWRFRRAFDWLWLDRDEPAPAAEPEPADVANGEDDGQAVTAPADADQAGGPETAAGAQDGADDGPDGLGLEDQAEGAPAPETEPSGSEAGRVVPMPDEQDETLEVGPDETGADSDDKALEPDTADAPGESRRRRATPGHRDLAGDLAEPRHARRNANVVDACRILESELGIASPNSLEAGVKAARSRYADADSWLYAFHLLVMYSARLDWTGHRDDRIKQQVIEQLWSDLAGRMMAARKGERTVPERSLRRARLVLVDLLLSRHDFARVRAVFSMADRLSELEHEMQALACAGLAQQIGTHEELRDMLRYEAIDHCFMAGMHGVWRRDMVEQLLGKTSGQAEAIRLLDEHRPVVLP